MIQERTIEATVAEFEAWYSSDVEDKPLETATAAGVLRDLFARAQRGAADLHDPDGELIGWLARDLARDDDAAEDAYLQARLLLPIYLLFLRARDRWRRSEHAVQLAWEELGVTAQRPLGLTTLGNFFDGIIAAALAQQPDPTHVLAVGVERAFVTPLRATLDALAGRGELTRGELAELVGLPEDSVALDLWHEMLREAELASGDEDGRLTPLRTVTDAGGCPPPSAPLIERIVRSLTRAAVLRVFDADGDDGLVKVPRGTGLLAALVASTDRGLYLPEEEDDSEDSTASVVQLYVSMMLGEGDERLPALVEEVWEVLRALVHFGVLQEETLPAGSLVLLMPEPLQRACFRAVRDATGVTGTPDDTAPWQPVELPFTMAADTGVDVVATFEHDPGIWRRVRIVGKLTLHDLHDVLQSTFGWRDVREYRYAGADGTHRFAAQWLLRHLRGVEDAAVTDAGSVALGSVLRATGDELVYQYGHLDGPWLIRLRVERVMSGLAEPITLIDGAGHAPAEPTRIGEKLQARLPEGWTLPAELEYAWAFMESKGWMKTADNGVELVAPGSPQARPGLVFSSGLTLAHRWGAEHSALTRVLPIAVSPDETLVALWLDDGGAARVVALPPDGGASLLGDGAVDLLRLAAVGYPEISPRVLGRPPEDADAVAGVEEFRGWVRGQLGVDVPDMWGPLGQDGFTAWLADQG